MSSGPFQTDHKVVAGEVIYHANDIRAITAPNASPMTFTGTQTYVYGRGKVAIIDPGPNDASHHAAIMAALEPGETIEAVLVTHSHMDHSPLAKRFDVPVYGFGGHNAARAPIMETLGNLGGSEGIDPDFSPDVLVKDGDVVQGSGWSLDVIHTPGHLSNHVCFATDDIAFSGDHVMGWASTLISPPDGDLTAYMNSLDVMRRRGHTRYYPGHGAPIDDPMALVDWLGNHRRSRETQILAGLGANPASVSQLTSTIYADVSPKLHGAASRNVLAHIIDLYQRDIIGHDDEFSKDAVFFLK